MYSVTTVLIVLAFVFTLISAISGKVPLWIAVLLLCLAGLVGVLVKG